MGSNAVAGLVSRLTAENAALRHQLALVCQRTGQALPPLVMPPPMAPYFVPAGPGMVPMMMPMMGGTPKVTAGSHMHGGRSALFVVNR